MATLSPRKRVDKGPLSPAARQAGLSLVLLLSAAEASATPQAPELLCTQYPESPHCEPSNSVDCSFCHTVAPSLNPFGASLKQAFAGGDFATDLINALVASEGLDSDGDGVNNLDEVMAGKLPGKPDAAPAEESAECSNKGALFDVCAYDPVFAFIKVSRDFCGESPSFADVEDIRAANKTQAEQKIQDRLQACLDSESWLGENGTLWRIAHKKIRPLPAVKSGDGTGPIPLADYDVDYRLFTYTQIDGRDARELLTADYYVTLSRNPTRYNKVTNLPSVPNDKASLFDRVPFNIAGDNDNIAPARRAGMLTTQFYLFNFTMFSALPRTAAAQAYRAYLGLDIAKSEGLKPVAKEPVDYDAMGVAEPACAFCHSTLDPLAYPFRSYDGITIVNQLSTISLGTLRDLVIPYSYDTDRLQQFSFLSPNVTKMPEAGTLLGQKVTGLVEWAKVAANSPEFAQNLVRDYWQLLLKREPTAAEQGEFEKIWRDFSGVHNYSVEAMLADFVKTEAYGAP